MIAILLSCSFINVSKSVAMCNTAWWVNGRHGSVGLYKPCLNCTVPDKGQDKIKQCT